MFLDAVSNNLNFPNPRRDEFEHAMIKALKSTKERFRRQQKRPKDVQNINHGGENIETEEPLTRQPRILQIQAQEDDTLNDDQPMNSTLERQIEASRIQNYQKCTNENHLSDATEESLNYNLGYDEHSLDIDYFFKE